MVKILKKIGIVLLTIITLIIVSIFIAIQTDNHNTGYLKIKNHKNWESKDYIIKNVNIVPMTQDTVLYQKMIYIKDGIIQKIDSSITVKNIPIIDGENHYLTPGLIDMHVHVWDKYDLGLYLANGVTTVRNMWGIPEHLNMKEALNSNEIIGPQFFTATPKLTGSDDAGIDKVQIASPEEAKTLISDYKKQGYDLIKTYAGMPQPIFDAVIEQATIEDLQIASHPSHKVDYDYHFKPNIETIEHTEDILQTALNFDIDSTKLNAIINLYKTNQKSHTPTLNIFQNIIDILEEDDIRTSEMASYMNPGFLFLGSEDTYNRWTSEKQFNPEITQKFKAQHQTHLSIVKQLHDHGVNLVCGSDSGIMFSPAGFSTHEELSYYIDAGLTPYEALKTATVNPSKVSHLYQNVGTIEIGKTANLVLSKENPLENLNTLKSPEKVWINGRLLNNEDLNFLKTKAKDRPNTIASIYRMVLSFL